MNMMPGDEVPVADESEEEVLPYRYAITSYGADYPVDSLVKRLNDQVILIPHFQRGYVWTMAQASRFIESLLLGLPVPGIFLSKERATGKLLVIDGQQRLRTLQYFYAGVFRDTRAFALKNVQSRMEGRTYKTLDEQDRLMLDDSILHATVVKQEEPSDDESSIYHVFERLNTGGTLLQPQEIRACIFHGSFSELLKELNLLPAWRNVYGPQSKRLKDQELILRFFALYFNAANYRPPMKQFLNDYMGRNRELALQPREELEKTFARVIGFVSGSLGQQAFRPERALNAAVFDAVMVGLATRMRESPIVDAAAFLKAYADLLQDRKFLSAYISGTSTESSVRRRLELAEQYLGELT
jgi:hypothetical protein